MAKTAEEIKLEAELKKAQEALAEKDKVIAEKDVIITQKNQDIVGARKEYKRLTDLSAEEREKMSAKEIELHDAAMQQQAEMDAFRKEQEEYRETQRKEAVKNAIKAVIGDDPELYKKVEANFDKIKDSEKALTGEAISSIIANAVNMLGDEKPTNIVMNAHAHDGGTAHDDKSKKDFTDTDKGKKVAEQLFGAEDPIAKGEKVEEKKEDDDEGEGEGSGPEALGL